MTNKNLSDEILDIIENYGSCVDGQGWEIDERYEAVNKIIKVIKRVESETMRECAELADKLVELLAEKKKQI